MVKKENYSNKSSQRRKTLKTILLTGGATVAVTKALPHKWTKPIVDSVVLPAHAQTTTVVTTTSAPATTAAPTTTAAPPTTAAPTTTPAPTTTGGVIN